MQHCYSVTYKDSDGVRQRADVIAKNEAEAKEKVLQHGATSVTDIERSDVLWIWLWFWALLLVGIGLILWRS